MTLKNVLEFFEKYYHGKYTGVVLDAMTEYLAGCIEEYYQAIMEVVILRFSNTLGRLPDVAIIEKNHAEIKQVMSKKQDAKALPEPKEAKATDEEAEEFIRQFNSLFNRKTPDGKPLPETPLEKLLKAAVRGVA